MPEWDDLVAVGVVARPQGRRGEVIVNAVTDFADRRFVAGALLHARRRGQTTIEAVTIETARLHRGRPVLKLAGVDSIAAAEAWTGAELRISPERQHALPPGVYYHSQLVGCAVLTESGVRLGVVRRVEGEGDASRLVVRTARGELLVPLAEAICPRIDVGSREIVVRPPEGLLELNDAGSWTERGEPPAGRA